MKPVNVSISKLKRLMGNQLIKRDLKLFNRKINRARQCNKTYNLGTTSCNGEKTKFTFQIRHKPKTPNHYPKVEYDITIFKLTYSRIDSYQCDLRFLHPDFNVEKPNDNLVYNHVTPSLIEGGLYTNYHGITNQTMPVRLRQHEKADSNFGNSIRKYQGQQIFYAHIIVQDGMTRHDAFNLEEKVIKAHSLFRDNKGNNMIPGGYTGLRIAKRLGYKDRESAETDLEEAANNEKKLASICSKLYNWEPTDEQLSNIVCHNKNNFAKEEVRYIRILSLQIESIREIWKEFRDKYNYSIMNVGLFKRVESVVNGNSYRFVV